MFFRRVFKPLFLKGVIKYRQMPIYFPHSIHIVFLQIETLCFVVFAGILYIFTPNCSGDYDYYLKPNVAKKKKKEEKEKKNFKTCIIAFPPWFVLYMAVSKSDSSPALISILLLNKCASKTKRSDHGKLWGP